MVKLEIVNVIQVVEGKFMYCEQCGTKNESGSAFCINCGAKLIQATSVPIEPEPVKSAEETKQLCPVCQVAYAPGSQFCENCGHALGQPSGQVAKSTQAAEPISRQTLKQQAPAQHKRLWWLVGGIAVIGVAVGAGLYLNQPASQSVKQPTSTSSKKTTSAFKQSVNAAEAALAQDDYDTALEAYDQAWTTGTQTQQQSIKAKRSGLQVLKDSQALADQSDYQGVIDKIEDSGLLTKKGNVAYQPLQKLYKTAKTQVTSEKPLWGTSQSSELSSFMDSWGSTMHQSYQEYTDVDSVDMYGTQLPAALLSGDLKTEVDGQIVQINWSDDGTSESGYQIVAAYSDANTADYGAKHFYLFAIDNGQPKVLITMQNQGNNNHSIEFKETENQTLKNRFAEIVNDSTD